MCAVNEKAMIADALEILMNGIALSHEEREQIKEVAKKLRPVEKKVETPKKA